MTPADITASAEFRKGLARRLAEVGLAPPDPAIFRVAALPVPLATTEERKAA